MCSPLWFYPLFSTHMFLRLENIMTNINSENGSTLNFLHRNNRWIIPYFLNTKFDMESLLSININQYKVIRPCATTKNCYILNRNLCFTTSCQVSHFTKIREKHVIRSSLADKMGNTCNKWKICGLYIIHIVDMQFFLVEPGPILYWLANDPTDL